eukprot:1722277-Rhodomonas_salina.2
MTRLSASSELYIMIVFWNPGHHHDPKSRSLTRIRMVTIITIIILLCRIRNAHQTRHRRGTRLPVERSAQGHPSATASLAVADPGCHGHALSSACLLYMRHGMPKPWRCFLVPHRD